MQQKKVIEDMKTQKKKKSRGKTALKIFGRIGISLLIEAIFHLGVASYWWGNSLARVGPMIICMVYYFSGKWKTRKLLTEA